MCYRVDFGWLDDSLEVVQYPIFGSHGENPQMKGIKRISKG